MADRGFGELTPVKSSVLAAVGYSLTAILRLEFTSGKVYDYFTVPRRIHEELMGAASLGDYFNENIKDRFHSEQVIEPVR